MLVRFALNPYALASIASAIVSARVKLIVKSGINSGKICFTRLKSPLDLIPHSAPREAWALAILSAD